MEQQNVVKISAKELSLVEDNSLNEHQLKQLLRRTPDKFVRLRPAKGGGQWKYVTGGYVKKCLNLMFGWDWDFEIIDEKILEDEIVVKGKLTCRSNGKTIVKMQFGNKDIMKRKADKKPLSIGNDLKSATTDALKKCAAEIGIASDIYNSEEFREVNIEVNTITFEDLNELYQIKKEFLPEEDKPYAERIIKEKEEKSFNKLFNQLKSL